MRAGVPQSYLCDDLPCPASVPAPSQVNCSLGLCAHVHLCTHIPTRHMCTHVRIVIRPYTLTPHTYTHNHTHLCPCMHSPIHFPHTLTHQNIYMHSTHPCRIPYPHAPSSQTHLHTPIRHTSHMSTHTHTSRTPSPTHTHKRTIDALVIHTCSLPLTCTHLYSHTGALTHAHPTQELLPLRSVSPSSASWGTECQTLRGSPFGVAPYPPNCPPPCGC